VTLAAGTNAGAEKPLVSVVTTTWNAADYLRETIESVLAQTYAPLEIIVVDDGSTDHTARVCASFGDRVRYIHQEKDSAGGSTAVVKAFAAARGKYLAPLDHDDRWLPEKIERQVAAAEASPQAGAVFTRFRIIDSGGRDRGVAEASGPSGDVFHALLAGNRYCYSSALLRREASESIGGPLPFEDGIGLGDWDLWLRISRDYHVIMLEDVLTEYRVHDRSYSSDRRRMGQATRNVLMRNRDLCHRECADCEEGVRTGLRLAANAFLEDFHSRARSGRLATAGPSLRGAWAASREAVLGPRQLAAIVKSVAIGIAKGPPIKGQDR
jgi:glycosyltransferase involved in cell wall biosynthesis